MSVPPGGSAMINGVIYQMLWCLLETSRMHVRQSSQGGEGEGLVQATLVLEPSSGGDAALIRSENESVVQLKARSDGSAWSLHDLVHDVLPDLYRAVNLERNQKFVFFTEGHQGKWQEAQEFFSRLKSLPALEAGQQVSDVLDPMQRIRFGGSLVPPELSNNNPKPRNSTLSERDFFEQIVLILRKNKEFAKEPKDVTQHRLLKLLTHLEFRWDETQSALRVRILQHLRLIIDIPDTAEETLRSLITALQERATRGNAPIEAKEFFHEHGLSGAPLVRRQWPRLIDAATVMLNERLTALFDYSSSQDVRSDDINLMDDSNVSAWRRGSASCLALSGESGQGKTWRLCGLSCALSATAPVVAFQGGRNARQISTDAAHEFWFNLCNRNDHPRLDQIARRLRETGTVPSGDWLYIVVDGVVTSGEATELCQEFASIDGVRLVFTTSPEVADYVAQKPELKSVVVLPVVDFTEEEVRRYVVNNDPIRWHEIPFDLQQIIRRPLLARIYRDLSLSGGFDGKNEYALYDTYFRRHLIQELYHAGFPGAELFLMRAGLAIWDGCQYPWTSKKLIQTFGFSEALLSDLLQRGWLRKDIRNRFSIWHDRLKEWLVAHALAEDLENGERQAVDVGEALAVIISHGLGFGVQKFDAHRLMAYVPMDLCWQLSQRQKDNSALPSIVDTVLATVEDKSGDFPIAETLYTNLLPTIGSDIAPALFLRLLNSSRDHNDWLRRKWITACLIQLETKALVPTAISLLTHEDRGIRHSAIEILTCHPAGISLPPLWNSYQKRMHQYTHQNAASDKNSLEEQPESSFQRDDEWEMTLLRRALRASVALDVIWLKKEIDRVPQIAQVTSQEGAYVDVLISLTRHTEDGGAIWRDCKESLRPWVANDDHRHSHCAREFVEAVFDWKDTSEVAWLRNRAKTDTDRLGACCIRVLARIAPGEALEALSDLPLDQVRSSASWGLNYLLAQDLEATRERLTELLKIDRDHRSSYLVLFDQWPELLSTVTRDWLLDDEEPSGETDTKIDFKWQFVDRLADTNDLLSLQILWRNAGGEVEERLVDQCVNADTTHNPYLERLSRALFKMAGSGFTRIINYHIASDAYFTRVEGIKQALLRPDEKTVRLLEGLALYDNQRVDMRQTAGTQSESGQKDSLDIYAYLSQTALAAIKAYKPLIASVVLRANKTGLDVLNETGGNIRFSDDDMAPAIQAINDNPKNPGAIFALGVGRRTDYVPFIVSVLNAERVEVDNDITNACHYALAVMPNLPAEAVEALALRLPHTHSGWLLLPPLMNNPSGSALQVLVEYLRTGLMMFRTGPYSVANVNTLAEVAEYLLKNLEHQAEAVVLCKTRFCEGQELDSASQRIVMELAPFAREYDSVREVLDCQQVRDYLLLAAFRPGIFDGTQVVLGLAAFHPGDAYAAGLKILQNEAAQNRHRDAPWLLLDLDQNKAVSDLLKFMALGKPSQSIRHSIAQALAGKTSSNPDICKVVLNRASAASSRERSDACYILGFMHPSEDVMTTVSVALTDENITVFRAACEAWHKLDTARHVEELVKAFLVEDDKAKRWVLLDAALETGDPGESQRPAPGWLERAAVHLTRLEWDYIAVKLKSRREQRDQDLERTDRLRDFE